MIAFFVVRQPVEPFNVPEKDRIKKNYACKHENHSVSDYLE
jgi:hypothetical protein